MRILIIDDDKDVLSCLEQQVSRMGHDVIATSDSKEGFSIALDVTFDIVITDLTMPKVSGFKICHEVKKRSPDTKVIVITGNASDDRSFFSSLMGADMYMTKPWTISELKENIEKLKGKTLID